MKDLFPQKVREILITPSILIEYTFCPRFIFFMFALDIPQREGNRFKVVKGRNIHSEKAAANKEYLRKKLGIVEKQSEVYLASDRYHLRGIVDEVLTFSDGTMASLDYKYAQYTDINYKTHKIQAVCYTLLIEDNYKSKSRKAFIVYTRSKNKLIEFDFTDKDRAEIESMIENVLHIIKSGFFPEKTASQKRCSDCTFNKICV